MAKIIHCDCCGVVFEPKTQMNTVQLPAHSTTVDVLKGLMGHRNDSGFVSRMESLDICNDCSQAIYNTTSDVFRSIRNAKERSKEFTTEERIRTTAYVKEYKELLSRLRVLYANLPILQEKMEESCIHAFNQVREDIAQLITSPEKPKNKHELAKFIINSILSP